jgi:hypothetical protein
MQRNPDELPQGPDDSDGRGGSGDGGGGGGGGSKENVEHKNAEDKNAEDKNAERKKAGKKIAGEIEVKLFHDSKRDRDVGDDFSFNIEIRATYPALCTLESWDPQSSYLRKIVAKLKKQGADITQPLTQKNFKALVANCSLTKTQEDNLQKRIARVLTQIVNGMISSMDQRKAV